MDPETTKRVLVIGSSGLDIIGRPLKPLENGVSCPGIVRTSFGGVSRNIAENLARLGQPTSLISVVGKDDFGRRLLGQAEELGIDVHACFESDEYNTASYLAIIGEDGKIINGLDDMRILSLLTPEYLNNYAEMFEEASLIFVDMNLTTKALKTVFTLAKKCKVPICADTTSSVLARRLIPYLSKLYMVTANTLEAAVLCGDRPCISDPNEGLEAARFLVNCGVEVAVIPMAHAGVCYATSETNGHIPAIVTKVIDPTGAGDALTAAVMFGSLNNIPIDDAIRLGVSAASLTLMHTGTVFPELSLERLYGQLVI